MNVEKKGKDRMSSFYVRPMTASDLDKVSEIEKICFPTPWSKEAFRIEIEENRCARYFVAVYQGEIVGYGGMWLIIDEAHITNVAVHPNYRGLGVGEAIMRSLIQEAVGLGAIRMTLEVRISNKIAQNLYRKLGFYDAGIRKQYYSNNNEDALIMWNDQIRDIAKGLAK